MKRIDFFNFISQNQKILFGRSKTRLGIPFIVKYKKQFQTLDLKMNELVCQKKYSRDFLFGLFMLSLSQIVKRSNGSMTQSKMLFDVLLEGEL